MWSPLGSSGSWVLGVESSKAHRTQVSRRWVLVLQYWLSLHTSQNLCLYSASGEGKVFCVV